MCGSREVVHVTSKIQLRGPGKPGGLFPSEVGSLQGTGRSGGASGPKMQHPLITIPEKTKERNRTVFPEVRPQKLARLTPIDHLARNRTVLPAFRRVPWPGRGVFGFEAAAAGQSGDGREQ